MRILQVVHDFVPRHVAGAELYCYYLARALAARGQSVHVLFTESDWSRAQYSYRRFPLADLTCHEIVHNHEYRSFEHTYLDGQMDDRFTRVLDVERPDVVHLHHLWNHSLNYPRLARRRGIPVVFTLHDYWLSCLNHGQRLHPEHGVCAEIDTRLCADCVSRFPSVPRLATTLRRWWATGRRTRWPRHTRPSSVPTDQARLERAKSLYRQLVKQLTSARARATYATRRLEAARAAARDVDLFVAPSAFLAQRMIEFGLPAERVVHSPNGMRTDLLHIQRRPRRERVRFGYVGSVAPHKGVHILIDAFIKAIDRRTSRPMELRIHGSLAHFPAYVARLRALAGAAPISFFGEFDNTRASEVYAEFDALVIPSVWWENAPLTLFEARLTGKPIIASNGGSLPDLVGDRDTMFRNGDADDLARCLARFAERAPSTGAMTVDTRPVKTIVQDAAEMERRYTALIASALSSRARRAAGQAL